MSLGPGNGMEELRDAVGDDGTGVGASCERRGGRGRGEGGNH